MTEPSHVLGVALMKVFERSTTPSIIRNETRKINDVLAAYLSIAWIIELPIKNVLLLSPLKYQTLLLIALLLFIQVFDNAFS